MPALKITISLFLFGIVGSLKIFFTYTTNSKEKKLDPDQEDRETKYNLQYTGFNYGNLSLVVDDILGEYQ